MWKTFAMQKLLTIFQQNITAINFVSFVSLNESSAYAFVKLTMFQRTGPGTQVKSIIIVCIPLLSTDPIHKNKKK